MKKLIIYILMLIPASFTLPQEAKKVLVEIFTNSHCPLCPPAHDIITDYRNGPNGDKINIIYYHMVYPYPDDLLYLHNTEDSDGRDEYYNPVPATPRGFLDGMIQGSYSGWISVLDSLITLQSPFEINLSGKKKTNSISLKAEITRSGYIPDDNLVLHFVVVEDVIYAGRNGILNHDNVMRKMVDGPSGFPVSVETNETVEVEKEIPFHNEWIKDSLKVVVFIQSSSGMTVYQSEKIEYSELEDATGVTPVNFPDNFKLEQNFPNPFNPSTKIIYQLPAESFVTLRVFNVTGSEVSILVDNYQAAGSYQVNFNPEANLSSGIYFYKLTAIDFYGNRTEQTRKMTLIR